MKDFVLYNEAWALKELGFDESCSGFYSEKCEDNDKSGCSGRFTNMCGWSQGRENTNDLSSHDFIVSAPTYSQAFRWFREKHGLYVSQVPEFYQDGINFNWQILWYLSKGESKGGFVNDGTGWYGDNNEYPTQEDMELGILKKMIEIVKERK